MQGELFGALTFILRDALVSGDGRGTLLVIGCGRDKLTEPATADQLFTSERFRSCITLARELAAPFLILSGKHGVVEPDTLLAPYDLDLASLSSADQRCWARQAVERLALLAKGRTVTLLATAAYSAPVIAANRARSSPLTMLAPWAELGTSDCQVWLNEAHRMAARIRDLDRLYSWIDAQRRVGQVFPFATLSANQVPKRGVYLFLDPAEPNFRMNAPRVVRIGTHAVSTGSQASLRGRLRNHLGPANAIGNHRGSIFRLHVGRAMLEAGPGHAALASWGEGQDAGPEIKALEKTHELMVSNYLQQLEVVLLNIDDPPSKSSLRAHVETQLIALFSESLRPIDIPSSRWLGSSSPVPLVRQSGLWNIRGVGGKYDPFGVGSVRAMLEG